MTAPGKPRSEREIKSDAAYRRARRARLSENGICSRCGKAERRDEETVWCLGCIEKHDAQDRKNRVRVEAELKKVRPQMIALYGNPADIWLDNKCRDDVKMALIPNILRATKVLDAWKREA